MSEWMSVEERLPKGCKEVWLNADGEDEAQIGYLAGPGCWLNTEGWEFAKVSHWQPLIRPALPAKHKDQRTTTPAQKARADRTVHYMNRPMR